MVLAIERNQFSAIARRRAQRLSLTVRPIFDSSRRIRKAGRRLQLVHNQRVDGKARQQVVATLGRPNRRGQCGQDVRDPQSCPRRCRQGFAGRRRRPGARDSAARVRRCSGRHADGDHGSVVPKPKQKLVSHYAPRRYNFVVSKIGLSGYPAPKNAPTERAYLLRVLTPACCRRQALHRHACLRRQVSPVCFQGFRTHSYYGDDSARRPARPSAGGGRPRPRPAGSR